MSKTTLSDFISDQEIKEYVKGMESIVINNNLSHAAAKDIAEILGKLGSSITNHVRKELDKLEIYLACDDGSGEIFNRSSGQRFSIQKSNKKVSNQSKSIIPIGKWV